MTWTTAGPWMLGFLLGAFTIVGFESAANLAEETNDPERVVPRAMWQAVLASGVLGFIFIVAVTLAAGDPVALAESGTPIADVIDKTLGSAVATLLLLMVVLAIFACGLVIMITGVRLTWAMSRDERFPGWQQWNQISPRFHTPLKATVLYVVLAELILAIFSHSETALFTLFGAATLLPAVMYASTVVLYLIKRKSLPVSDKFNLGAWEIPILVVAVVWLVFELALFRDSSFKQAWAYVIVMVVIGARYLGYLLATRGRQRIVDARYALDRCRTTIVKRRTDKAMTHVLAIDQGTSGTKAIVVDDDRTGRVDRRGRAAADVSRRAAASSRIPRRCSTPSSTPAAKPSPRPAFRSPPSPWPTRARRSWRGIRATGRPLTPAIVWQDRRAESICAPLSASADAVAQRTGLVLDPYFSAPKMAWIRANLTRDGVVTTTDTWLVHRLCGAFVTDASTASRSLLTSLDSVAWDDELLDLFGLTGEALPEIVGSDEIVGTTDVFGPTIPVAGLIVDQQAALLAESCLDTRRPPSAPSAPARSCSPSWATTRRGPPSGLTTSVAWRLREHTSYCVDGQVYTAASAVRWAIDLGLVPAADQTRLRRSRFQ